MTIKKSKHTPEAETLTAPFNPGGATIADRLKLDVPDPNAQKGKGSGTAITLALGLVSLAVVGVLTFMLWQHWGFLKGA